MRLITSANFPILITEEVLPSPHPSSPSITTTPQTSEATLKRYTITLPAYTILASSTSPQEVHLTHFRALSTSTRTATYHTIRTGLTYKLQTEDDLGTVIDLHITRIRTILSISRREDGGKWKHFRLSRRPFNKFLTRRVYRENEEALKSEEITEMDWEEMISVAEVGAFIWELMGWQDDGEIEREMEKEEVAIEEQVLKFYEGVLESIRLERMWAKKDDSSKWGASGKGEEGWKKPKREEEPKGPVDWAKIWRDQGWIVGEGRENFAWRAVGTSETSGMESVKEVEESGNEGTDLNTELNRWETEEPEKTWGREIWSRQEGRPC